MERWTIPECNGVARIIIFIPSLISGGGPVFLCLLFFINNILY